MYDVLFIDDEFQEIKDTFSVLQKEHVRCFYSDGEKYLPQSDKEKLPFKNLKYICLDFYLQNIGINGSTDNKTAVSALAGIVKKFIFPESSSVCIIVNTAFPGHFKDVEKDFIKYLKFPREIEIEAKDNNDNGKFSSLHGKYGDQIRKESHPSLLRNLVIREAIEIENIIFEQIDISKKDNWQGHSFGNKIAYYHCLKKDDALYDKLIELKNLRNKYAHDDSPPEKKLLDFLEEIEDIEKRINP